MKTFTVATAISLPSLMLRIFAICLRPLPRENKFYEENLMLNKKVVHTTLSYLMLRVKQFLLTEIIVVSDTTVLYYTFAKEQE